ncbi:DUF2303 family protein [Gordonia sp. KTR9]|uniref:DUF2303 family protein n=1 Tax=Gordonia sp. KTR9 TaxID=337191 RepID=UPI00027DD9A8|nr:DUF2303 family protein [Gordonia sp. KTR9]AFR47983.1 hypothetical protein KTR9_1343 [Gordonia sp. KTR9]
MTINFKEQLVQDDDAQKLLLVDPSETPGIQQGIGIIAATTKDKGLQVETVDLREFIPGVTRSAEEGTRLVTDVPSFLAELDRYPIAPELSTLWGDETKGRIEAIYNDHNADGAGLRDNRLRLELRADDDWVAWHRLSGKYFPQIEFGDAVEELLHTVVDPDQADLVEVINSIRATSKGVFESAVDRSNGSQALEYRTETTATAGAAGRASRLEIPQTVTLAIRPWEGLDTYKVEGWFRFNTDHGRLLLTIKLKPTRNVLRAAWADVVEQIETHLGGKPVLATRFDR